MVLACISQPASPRPEPMAVPFVRFCISTTKTGKNSAKTACDPAVFLLANPLQPRISAENAIALADKFVQKQQKQ